jgi:hypothetical protein
MEAVALSKRQDRSPTSVGDIPTDIKFKKYLNQSKNK